MDKNLKTDFNLRLENWKQMLHEDITENFAEIPNGKERRAIISKAKAAITTAITTIKKDIKSLPNT